jgi:hypothetical protein
VPHIFGTVETGQSLERIAQDAIGFDEPTAEAVEGLNVVVVRSVPNIVLPLEILENFDDCFDGELGL